MSDLAKWGILVAGALVVIGLILALPIAAGLQPGILSDGVNAILQYCADAFRFGRGLVNNFLLPAARPVLTAVMIWLLAKWVLLIGIKISTWIYHFIFK